MPLGELQPKFAEICQSVGCRMISSCSSLSPLKKKKALLYFTYIEMEISKMGGAPVSNFDL